MINTWNPWSNSEIIILKIPADISGYTPSEILVEIPEKSSAGIPAKTSGGRKCSGAITGIMPGNFLRKLYEGILLEISWRNHEGNPVRYPEDAPAEIPERFPIGILEEFMGESQEKSLNEILE